MRLHKKITAYRGTLSTRQTLQLASYYLEYAHNITDHDIALILCRDAKSALTHVKRAAKWVPKYAHDQNLRQGTAAAYSELGKLQNDLREADKAQVSYKIAQEFGAVGNDGGFNEKELSTQSSYPDSVVESVKDTPLLTQPSIEFTPPAVEVTPPSIEITLPPIEVIIPLMEVTPHSMEVTSVADPTSDPSPSQGKQDTDVAKVPLNIFVGNVRLPAIVFKPPEPDERLNDTQQLTYCLGLLQTDTSPDDILDPIARKWLLTTKTDSDEQERLKVMARDVIRAFKRDELKDANTVVEVVQLAPVLEKNDFQYLLREFYSGFEHSGLLDDHQLEGISQMIQGADPDHLHADDLVKILTLLSTRLSDTHNQSPIHIYKLTLTVSHILDAMADAEIKDLDREKLHQPLLLYLDGLKKNSDAYLIYQAVYAYQALLRVPDNETPWKATRRRTGKVIKGVSGLVTAVKGLDLIGFVEGLKEIQQGLDGVSKVVKVVKTTYDGVTSLAKSGQGFMDCLKEGLSFDHKCAWYQALRGADTLIQDGQLAKFRKLVCEAPCRLDPAFQWGVCQRLGDLAVNPVWDLDTRLSAVMFLGEIYQNDAEWGQHATIKQWILDILMQLSSLTMDDMQSQHMLTVVDTLLQELGKNGDPKKQDLYRSCREDGPGSHPLKIVLRAPGLSSLLDRVQERLDVEGNLRQLKKLRLKERGNVVYISPQAKADLQAHDEARFPLMETVMNSLTGKQEVFLLLGDSGSGKSTFNRELECQLWQKYKKNGPIPLHINLPSIDKPEHDMISKRLRKAEFTEPQIRELKLNRKFILICDGYDESQQTHNLYTSNRLNEPGEWSAKMVISCRSEYLGVNYRDRFQPVGRNHRSDEALFQKAVITPFSSDQVQEYIEQYVSVHRPLWEVKQFRQALDGIPSLKELVKNPFLMSLSLEVLPRMVDPLQNVSVTRITRVALYDQFIEHWFERGKKRLGEMNMSSQARAAFENLSDEGFTQNGLDFLKKLSAAIYKEQGGQPIVGYSRYKDESSWKGVFFSREEEKRLLREACPLIRNGNQHRFIHRSLLEYGLVLAIFDPQEWKETTSPETTLDRRGSASSDLSFVIRNTGKDVNVTARMEPDLNSPLAWRDFVNEPSILQFLEERVQQEPAFKRLLLDYIEQSKADKKWRTAAANAITVLVRAGVQFNQADLQEIRIPGADISFGVFESAQLQGADLRHVNLRGVFLQQADLSKAQMTGVQFGELPYLPQNSNVMSSTYSPDGKSFAVRLNGEFNVYSTSTWERLWTSSEHRGSVESITYSPHGDQIASGSSDKTVRLWDVRTGECRHVLAGHSRGVNCVAYSPQGDHIASASDDRTIRLWNAETGDCRNILLGHTRAVSRVLYSPNVSQLASCSWDTTVRIWDLDTGACSHALSGHSGWVRSIVYSPQGDRMASASSDKTVRLWDVKTGECLHILTGHSDDAFVVYSPKGDQLASANNGNTVRLWDVHTGSCRYNLTDHTSTVFQVSYSPRGDQLASASVDNSVRLWDPETGECHQTLSGHTSGVTSVVYSPKGDQLASGSDDNTVRLWDVIASASRHKSSGHRSGVLCVQHSPKGGQVASCSNDRTIRLWDVETGTCRRTLTGHIDAVCWIVYAPTGDQIASASHDCTVRLWDVETGECSKTLRGHTGWVYRVAYSPEGNRIASCSTDCTLRLWDVETGVCIHTLSGYSYDFWTVEYSPRGGQIASASWDGTVRLWDVDTGNCLHVLTGHSHWIFSAIFSPGGDQVASSSADNTVRLWDIGTGECCHVLIGHSDWVNRVVYSPRGDQIASNSDDKTVRLWDVETGACIHVLTGHRLGVSRVAYSPQGDMIASTSADNSLRLWDVISGQCRAVIQNGPDDCVLSINWSTTFDNYLFAGCEDGLVMMWRVITDEDRCDMHLRWRTTTGELVVKDASIQDVRGLSQLNRHFLEQRGSVGEPIHHLQEARRCICGI